LFDPLAVAQEARAALRSDEVFLDVYAVEDRYIVFIVGPAETAMVVLEERARIDDLVATLGLEGTAAQDPRARLAVDEFEATLAELSARVWEPLARHVSEDSTLLFAPEGLLAAVPFHALRNTSIGEPLLRRHTVYVVESARQLARRGDASTPRGKAERNQILALVDVDPGGDAPTVGRLATKGASCQWRKWSRLAGEGALLEEIQSSDNEVELLRGAQATVAALRANLELRPDVLHFDTHGFAGCEGIPDDAGDPLTQAGLVLASANQSPQGNEGDDGVLLASEVLELDLSSVELAVLSSCESAAGGLDDEALIGLRTAFLAAGADSVVAYLWEIDETSAADLTAGLYRGADRYEAWRNTVLDLWDDVGPQAGAASIYVGLPHTSEKQQ